MGAYEHFSFCNDILQILKNTYRKNIMLYVVRFIIFVIKLVQMSYVCEGACGLSGLQGRQGRGYVCGLSVLLAYVSSQQGRFSGVCHRHSLLRRGIDTCMYVIVNVINHYTAQK
jgi:hypothetical protein